ncbi:MAG: DUF6078 family protein [Mediterranea sp.]|jgi:hypothetical protein|nr:DUF6078 family protein [Mediterranea sp.]
MRPNIDYNTLPIPFAHCANAQCSRADHCLRRLATDLMPKERLFYTAINPAQFAPDGADCTCFIDDKPLLFARGMTHLLDKVPHIHAKSIRNKLIGLWGKSSYYRRQKKEQLISPQEQAYIQRLFLRYGITETPQFDEYVEAYDLK